MRISDWSSDVCSSDLDLRREHQVGGCRGAAHDLVLDRLDVDGLVEGLAHALVLEGILPLHAGVQQLVTVLIEAEKDGARLRSRSEEHTSELQSLMRTSYAVFCLKKNKTNTQHH